MKGAGIAMALLAAPALVAAHAFAPALLDLREQAPGVFAVRLEGPPGLEPRLPARCTHVSGGSTARAFSVACGGEGLRGAALTVDGLVAGRIDALVRITWRDGTSLAGTAPLAVPAGPVAEGAAAPAVALGYVRLGVEHIWSGPDHLLFVLGLLLLVRGWAPLVRTVSAFTLAHSVTLALAVLKVVAVPPAPVEALIALSIVLVAAELVRSEDAPPTLARRFPWLVAFAFGLLHGLGFAGALVQAGLPPAHVPLALVAFNGGVEVGQLLFVAVMLGPAAFVRPRPWLRLVPAYAIGTVAMAWTVERLAALWA
ncbi:MAG TPA: HupE/UreJ family protein [Candidatus Binatia bacterium]|nr:HupE/UreJ family protein [Candidatus Binatia bacterium]